MGTKRKKKEADVPEGLCLFTVKELDFISRGSKMIRWDVDVQTASINVPPNEVAEAEENLTVQYFCNQLGFQIQTVIYCPVKEVFDPALKERKAPTVAEEEVYCKIGDRFQNARSFVKMEVVDIKRGEARKHAKTGKELDRDDTVMLQHVGTVRFPDPVPLKTVKEMVRRRAWVRL